jgi:hypothetical protein
MTQVSTTVTSLLPATSPVQNPMIVKQLSASSIRTLSDIPPLSSAASYASSSSSIPFHDEEVDVVTEEGLRHADMNLEAR